MKSSKWVNSLKGRYSKVNHEIHGEEVENFITCTYLKTVDSSYNLLGYINEWDAMLSFKYKITREMRVLDNRYQVTVFGVKLIITLSK